MNLTEIEGMWGAPDRTEVASQFLRDLDGPGREALLDFFDLLMTRAAARAVLMPHVSRAVGLGVGGKPEEVGLLLVLSYVTGYADLLPYLPSQLRESEIEEVSVVTGVASELVREAAMLGLGELRSVRSRLLSKTIKV